VAHRVVFRPSAEEDLDRIDDYIARDNPLAASAFVRRIRERCQALAELPHCSTRRDDLRAGLRTVGFERRATIVFRIEGRTVRIRRILYGERDLSRRTPHL
jgi:toxin ParE1/3/4